MTFIDPFGRAITYLRISLTDCCNLGCVYCMPKQGLHWQPRTDQLSVDEIVRVVETASQGGVKRVRLTGGEPLVHPKIVEIVRGLNADELPALANLTIEHDWHVRFIEVMPIGNAQDWGKGFPTPNERYVSVQEMHAQLSTFNLQPSTPPQGNGPARTYRIPGALGTVGCISPLGEHFCQNCNRLRLTSDGKLRSCLVIPAEVSLRDALRSGTPLEDFFQQAIAQKPEHHDMLVAVPANSQRGMSQIGG